MACHDLVLQVIIQRKETCTNKLAISRLPELRVASHLYLVDFTTTPSFTLLGLVGYSLIIFCVEGLNHHIV